MVDFMIYFIQTSQENVHPECIYMQRFLQMNSLE